MNARALPFAVALAVFARAQSVAEIPASGCAGWEAAVVHRGEQGVWYAHAAKVIDAYGAPEIIATDDAGRVLVLSVYSGKWTPLGVTPDGQWLAPSRPADVDPRVPGREIYAAGKAGNVHRVHVEALPFGKFELRSVEVGHLAGEEFHTVVAEDLDPTRPGDELLAFAISGAVVALTPGSGASDFDMRKVADLPGRMRDAVVLPGVPPAIVGPTRSGHVIALRMTVRGIDSEVLAREPMGLGRIAIGAGGRVLWVTRDDGVLLRFARNADGTWAREVAFAGAQGLRGVAAGRFFAEPEREAVAVYGYGKQVQLVWREAGGPWRVDTIFRGEAQGHWLTVGEFDGRNGTEELVAAGFGGEVVLLRRPVGYGLPGAAVDVAPAVEPALRPPRIAVKASDLLLPPNFAWRVD